MTLPLPHFPQRTASRRTGAVPLSAVRPSSRAPSRTQPQTRTSARPQARTQAHPTPGYRARFSAVERLLENPNPPPERLRTFLGALARHAHDAITGARHTLPFERWLSHEVITHLRSRIAHHTGAHPDILVSRRETAHEVRVHLQRTGPLRRDVVVVLQNSQRCFAVSLVLQWRSRRWLVTELWVL